MVDRRSLKDGLLPPPTREELAFIKGEKLEETPPVETRPKVVVNPLQHSRRPLSTRIRAEYAIALKRASLERQLAGEYPNTISEILNELLGPWLKSNGYLP